MIKEEGDLREPPWEPIYKGALREKETARTVTWASLDPRQATLRLRERTMRTWDRTAPEATGPRGQGTGKGTLPHWGEAARASGSGAVDGEGFQEVGPSRRHNRGRWNNGPPKPTQYDANGGGKGAQPAAGGKGGKGSKGKGQEYYDRVWHNAPGQGAQPPDASGAQQAVEKNIWMVVREAKVRAEWLLAYLKPSPEEKEFFGKMVREMDSLGIHEGEGKGVSDARTGQTGSNPGRKDAKGSRIGSEIPLELQIRDIHGRQKKRAKARGNLELRLDKAKSELERWDAEVERVTEMLDSRDEADEALAKEAKTLASRLARAAGCKVRRSQSDGSSEGSGGSEGGSEDDDDNNGGYGEGSGDNFGIEGVPTTLPDILSFAMGKINVYASGEAKELHSSIRGFLRVATARETGSAPNTQRQIADIAGEMRAKSAAKD